MDLTGFRLCCVRSVFWSVKAASFNCANPNSVMERLVCASPSLGARDDALQQLYQSSLKSNAAADQRSAQRKWLVEAQACHQATCLTEAYDRRLGVLLQSDGGRGIATRFHQEHAPFTGDLIIVRIGDWIVFDVVQTAIGPKGEAAGDASAARLTGAAQMHGPVGVEHKDLCEVTLQSNPNNTWSVGTRHCFVDDGANMGGLYRPASE